MRATDELRRILDERGVIYTGSVRAGEDRVTWIDASLRPVTATPFGDGLMLNAVLTPETVVDVTMGRETCHNACEPSASHRLFECSECGSTHLRTPAFIDILHYCPNCGRRVTK